VNNLNVLVKQVGKSSITELGAPKDFLEKINYLFGDQVFTGESPMLRHCSENVERR
jgi:hypothetical protein